MLIKGTRGSDWLSGTNLADQIYGGYGNDTIYGSDGDDLIQGGPDNDNMVGEGGNDDIRGGQGDDRLWDFWGNDHLTGGAGNDLLGGNAVDYQRDVIQGGPGNDSVHGGTGFDLTIGGSGDDYFEIMGGECYGDDVRSLTFGNDAIYSNLSKDYGTPRIITGGLGADRFYLEANPEGVATAVTISDFHNGEDDLQFYQVDYQANYVHPLAKELDSNGDGHLDANDGWSFAGHVSVDSSSVTLTAGDGDSIRLMGVDHVDYLL